MLNLNNGKTYIKELLYINNDAENTILKNCLFDDYEKYQKQLVNGSCKFMVCKNLGFIVIKITEKYIDLLGGMRSDKAEKAIQKTTPVLLDYAKQNNLIFRVQSQFKKVALEYLKIKGFKSIEKNGMFLLYNTGV